MGEGDPASSDEEDKPAPSAAEGAPSFFDSNANATELKFTEEAPHAEDERVPGESDSDGESVAEEWRRKQKRRVRRKKDHRRIVISMLSSKYEIIAQAARGLGWRCATDDSEEYNLLWADSYISFDTISNLNKYQKCNHFPGMSELAKKNLLAKNLNKIAKALPSDFTFTPHTFVLPGEMEPMRIWFQAQVRARRSLPSPRPPPRPTRHVPAPTRSRTHT